jgi:hypothetical protein
MMKSAMTDAKKSLAGLLVFVVGAILQPPIQDGAKAVACYFAPTVEYFCGKPDAKPNNPSAPAATSATPAYR